MVVIFGWGAGGTKDLGEVAPLTCPNCHNGVWLHYIHSEKQISLYFVPLMPYGSDEYLACPICRAGIQLRPEQAPAVRAMSAATSSFRRGLLPEPAYRPQVEQFWRTLGIPVVADRVTAPPAGTAEPTLAQRLGDLGRLHDDGVLTDDEFAAAKRRLLER